MINSECIQDNISFWKVQIILTKTLAQHDLKVRSRSQSAHLILYDLRGQNLHSRCILELCAGTSYLAKFANNSGAESAPTNKETDCLFIKYRKFVLNNRHSAVRCETWGKTKHWEGPLSNMSDAEERQSILLSDKHGQSFETSSPLANAPVLTSPTGRWGRGSEAEIDWNPS